MSSSTRLPLLQPHLPGDDIQGRHALARAWIAAALMLGVVVASSLVMNRIEPEIGFFGSWLVLAALAIVALTFAVVAVRSGQQAQRLGRESGIVPAAIAFTVGGLVGLLTVVTLVAHLLGFE